MANYKKHTIALAAPSGGGKTTLCQMLLKKYRATCLSISFTTRPPRGQERDGVEYHFVNREKFEDLLQKGDLLEWAEVHGNYYGTSRGFMDTQINAGKVILLDVDVQGVASVKRTYAEKALSIFILPPSMEALEERLRSRNTESEEKIRQRLANARLEMAKAKDFDHRIVNHTIEQSFQELCSIVEREVGLVD